MTIAVIRFFDTDGRAHIMSVVAEGSQVEYVLRAGVSDAVLTPERPKKFVPLFEEEYERSPESSEDWALCATYNMGFVFGQGFEENSYTSLKEAAKAESALIAESVAAVEESSKDSTSPQVWSDNEISITTGNLQALIDDDTVKYILLLDPSIGKVLARVKGQWSNDLDDSDWDKIEDLDSVAVSTAYLPKFDEGDTSVNTVNMFRTDSEETENE